MAIIDSNDNVNYKTISKHKMWPTKYDFLWNVPFNHPATLFVADLFKKAYGYRVAKETKRGQDYDMFMRMYSIGYIGMNLDEPLCLYRIDEANYKRRTFSARIDECIIRYKGFKANKILIDGLPFILKPIIVYFVKRIMTYITNRNY